MRKFVPVSLFLVLFALSLGACGSDPNNNLSPTPDSAFASPSPALIRSGTPALIIGPITNPTVFGEGTLLPPTLTLASSPATLSPTAAVGALPTWGPVIIQTSIPLPTESPTLTPTAPLPESPTPSVSLSTIAPATGPTQPFGSVVGENYTPPPTFTPFPTATLPNGSLPPPFTPGPSPTPSEALRPDLMGIQIHNDLTDAQFDQMLARVQELGVSWVKIQIRWDQCEPEPGVFSEFYQAQVLNIQRASIRGFKTMLSVTHAPDWARPENVRGIEDGPSENTTDWATFVGRLVRDVKPEFIDAIELWNEPNLIREWRGKPISGSEYFKYFRAAYEIIQQEQMSGRSVLKPDHRIMVITAGPAPTVTFTGSTIGDREFIQQLYDAGLANLGSDVVLGVHPYGWGNPPEARCCQAAPGVTGWFEHPSFYFLETLENYREIMRRNNHAEGKMWITEFGWATYDSLIRSDGSPAEADAGVGWQNLIDADQQAKYIVRAFRLAQQPPYYDYLGPMILWNLNYSMIPGILDKGGEQAGFSLLAGDGSARPAFEALREALH
ncbi:hypothetical protein ANRL4_01931 [Anaerolineae bacterium]|nr:hypothetical protein ANRL4_01931 [Anaerolineae bacterium]